MIGIANGGGDPYPAAVPSAGVITSWTFNAHPTEDGAPYQAQLPGAGG